jgi:archaellum component FlaC
MDGHDFAKRLEILEEMVHGLEKLPARFDALEARGASVEGQILDLRIEMRSEFSAVHQQLTTINARLGQMDERFAGIDVRLDRMDDRFAAIDVRLGRMDERFAEIDVRLDRVDDRFAGIGTRLDRMHARLEKIDDEFAQMRKEIRLGDEETRRYMRVLHEDLVERFAILGNELGLGPKPLRRRR